MKVALYARVSTKQHGQDVETQLQALRAWARSKKLQAVEYADRGWSGGKDSRPELDRMMRDAREKRFQMVAVARFDRFGRSTRHLIQGLEEFQRLGIDFVSLGESIDTRTPVGKMVYTVISAVAEFERAIIAERVKMGLERARSLGHRIGRPRNSLVDERKIAREVHKGRPILHIAREFGIARATVRKIGKRRV